MRITRWSLGLLLTLPMGIAAAHPRQQGDALAEAARRAQAQKKSDSATQKVWTNENIPTTPGFVSVVGPTPAAPAAAADAGSTPAAPAQTASSANKAAITDENRGAIQTALSAAKLDLNTVTTDLDILTRKQVLDSQTYYSKPDYASDTAGAAALKDEQDEVDAKKEQVADAQKKVNDLQDQLASFSSDSGAASAPAGSPTTPPATPDSNSPTPSKPDPNYRPGE